jgi:hypothetical protein
VRSFATAGWAKTSRLRHNPKNARILFIDAPDRVFPTLGR